MSSSATESNGQIRALAQAIEAKNDVTAKQLAIKIAEGLIARHRDYVNTLVKNRDEGIAEIINKIEAIAKAHGTDNPFANKPDLIKKVAAAIMDVLIQYPGEENLCNIMFETNTGILRHRRLEISNFSFLSHSSNAQQSSVPDDDEPLGYSLQK